MAILNFDIAGMRQRKRQEAEEKTIADFMRQQNPMIPEGVGVGNAVKLDQFIRDRQAAEAQGEVSRLSDFMLPDRSGPNRGRLPSMATATGDAGAYLQDMAQRFPMSGIDTQSVLQNFQKQYASTQPVAKEPKIMTFGDQPFVVTPEGATQIPGVPKKDPKSDAERDFQARIGALKQQFAISDAEATGIVLGTIKITPDEVSGTRYITDLVSGTERPLRQAGGRTPRQPEGAPEPVPQRYEGPTLYELADIATGPASALRAGVSTISGMVGGPTADQTVEARQFLRNSANMLVRSEAINRRFPVGEMEWIKGELNLLPTLLDNKGHYRARARAIDVHLREKLQIERQASDDMLLPVAVRQDARSAAKDIESFLQRLGVPAEPMPAHSGGLQPGQIEDGYRFTGGDPADPGNWERVE